MENNKKVIFKEPTRYKSHITIPNLKECVLGHGIVINRLNLKECVEAAVYQSTHKGCGMK